MGRILTTILFSSIIVACGPKSSKTDKETINNPVLLELGKKGFHDFTNQFKIINLPFKIEDSIIWLSTYVEMKAWDKLDTVDINNYLTFEKETKNNIGFNELIRFFNVGQISVDTNIVALVYLKSYKSQYVNGGKKDIYKLITLDKSGKLISQLDLAGFITYIYNGTDKSFWNTCQINRDLSINLIIKDRLADYDKDTLYLLSEKNIKYLIRHDGKIDSIPIP
jgi:hypothetical protein